MSFRKYVAATTSSCCSIDMTSPELDPCPFPAHPSCLISYITSYLLSNPEISSFMLIFLTYLLFLVSQIQVTDVLQNCVLGENPSSWSISDEFGGSTTQKRKQSLVYHRCYNDTTFIPLWHAFSIMDIRSVGQALLGRLMVIIVTYFLSLIRYSFLLSMYRINSLEHDFDGR